MKILFNLKNKNRDIKLMKTPNFKNSKPNKIRSYNKNLPTRLIILRK